MGGELDTGSEGSGDGAFSHGWPEVCFPAAGEPSDEAIVGGGEKVVECGCVEVAGRGIECGGGGEGVE